MRADIGTEVTLDTVIRIPYRYINGNAALLVCGGTGRSGAVYIILECGYREVITFLSVYCCLNRIDEFNNVCSSFGRMNHIKAFVLTVLPAVRNLYFDNALGACVDGCPVLHDYILALAAVCSLGSCLHEFVCLRCRDNPCQLKESRLKNRIDTCRAHAGLNTKLHTVDGIELDIMVGDELLHLSREMLFKAFHIPWAVQQECTAVHQLLNHVVLADICRVMACNEVSLADQVCGLDRSMSKTQMRHRYTAGLLGIIIKVRLGIHIGVVTDDLDGVLVCADGTICAKSPEFTVRRSFRSRY